MKKSYIWIGALLVVLLIAIVGLIAFGISGGVDALPEESVDLIGTWEVAAVVENDNPIFAEDEYMVFDETRASNFRGGNPEPFASSTYEISTDNQLSLPDVSRNYKIDKKTDNCVRLYETAEKYMILIRRSDADMSRVTIDTAKIVGKWNVVYRNSFDVEPMNEILEFSADELYDYRNGSAEPVSTSSYSWTEDNCLYAEKWSMTVEIRLMTEERIIFIEKNTGIIWELEKIN